MNLGSNHDMGLVSWSKNDSYKRWEVLGIKGKHPYNSQDELPNLGVGAP